MWLLQSSAVTVKIGPFVDENDGKTAETALGLVQADIRLSKNGGNMAQKNDANAPVHDEIGWYDCQINVTDTNTLGRLVLMVHKTGALPVWHTYMVLPANTYNSLVAGTDNLDVTVDAVSDASITDAVWDELVAGHVIAGSAGATLAAISVAGMADAVWDELLSGHTVAGSAGLALSVGGQASAVWSYVLEPGASTTARTAAQLMRLVSSALFGEDAGVGDWSALSLDGSKTRISGTLDATGKRLSVDTLDGS